MVAFTVCRSVRPHGTETVLLLSLEVKFIFKTRVEFTWGWVGEGVCVCGRIAATHSCTVVNSANLHGRLLTKRTHKFARLDRLHRPFPDGCPSLDAQHETPVVAHVNAVQQ